MATSSSSRGTSPSWFAGKLSPEILALIVKHLYWIDSSSAASARAVSKEFNTVATPVVYHTLVLNKRIVAPDAAALFPGVLRDIANYTNHVVARSNLDPVGIKRVLSSLQSLESVRWQYTVNPGFHSGLFWLPSDVLPHEKTGSRATRLYIDDLPLCDFEEQPDDLYMRAIPSQFLVGLKLANPVSSLTTRLNSLKLLLLSSPHLEIFHYEDRGQGTSFNFGPREKFAPFKHLNLKSYDWNHTKQAVARHWDLSRLESLSLVSVPIFNFLSSVNFDDLSNLTSLHCEDFSAHQTNDRRKEATSGLHVLVKSHIRHLRHLSITCYIDSFPLDGLLAHADTLESLHFRDHAGFHEDDRRCPTLWPADLAKLAPRLRRVHTLELDMDVGLCDPPEFLRALCAFPKLHTLTLHVQTVLHPLEVIPRGTDRDQDTAQRTLTFLLQHKESIARTASVAGGKTGLQPWRKITINVGGWRRTMVRRCSMAWRKHNANGIFAERCFVLERDDNEGGQMIFTEEKCLDLSPPLSSDI